MRDLGIAILREVGVDTGGCNIQFAVNPADGRLVVIEMNPRVSRSSALASKATGFPIAKIAAKLAIGYTLDEIVNDITKETPACFEPTLDYVVVKAPRFAFEKFPGADPTLTTTMKSVGEAMSLGRNFIEALGKVMRSLETDRAGLLDRRPTPTCDSRRCAGRPQDADRRSALRHRTGAAPRRHRRAGGGGLRRRPVVRRADRRAGDAAGRVARRAGARRGVAAPGQAQRPVGPPDRRAATGTGRRGRCARAAPAARHPSGVQDRRHLRRRVRGASTPYHYSSYELDPAAETEVAPQAERPKVLILGSGPNRIGQGIEFDYSCVHAATTLSEAGFETVMVNCNPETVSTDYDTADRLYFEPLDLRGRPGGLLRRIRLRDRRSRRRRRDRATRRADAAGPGAAARRRRRSDRRHQPQGDRPRRRPRRVRRGAQHRRAARTAVRHRDQLRAGPPDRRRHRLPGAGPALLRARRARHGDRLRRGHPAGLHHPRHRTLARASGARRPVPRRRHRDRRRRALRRHRGVPRRDHGAHRGGRHPLRRLGVCTATGHVGPQRHRVGPAGHRGHRARDRRGRPAQRAVRAEGRCALRAGGQPAGQPHGAVRLQGHGRAARQGVRANHAGRHHRPTARRGRAGSNRRRRDHRAQRAGGREGSRPALSSVPQGRWSAGRLAAGPGDEVDRRGDGHRPRLRQRVRQEPDRRLRFAARPRARCSSRWPTGTSDRWSSR